MNISEDNKMSNSNDEQSSGSTPTASRKKYDDPNKVARNKDEDEIYPEVIKPTEKPTNKKNK